MPRKISFKVGEKVGKLTYIEDLGMKPYGKNKARFGLFECECGNIVEKMVACVRNEDTKSCGCLERLYKLKIKIGDKVERLTFKEDLGVVKVGSKNVRRGVFACDCGTIKEISVTDVVNGNTKSCGCYSVDNARERMTTHGLTNHPVRHVWSSMIARCYNKNDQRYNTYGLRGIFVCDEWRNDFLEFYNWAIENGWRKGLQIDRIDNEDGYHPLNCQFITIKENCAIGKRGMQSNNTSGYVGVRREHGKWTANIVINGDKIRIGRFANIEEAVEARIVKEIELFGEQKMNFHYDRNNFKKD